MVKEEFVFVDAELQPETVTLTRAEIDALNTYAEKVRRETIKTVLGEVEEMLQMRYRVENSWVSLCANPDDRGNYLYGKNLCEKLIFDLLQIKKRYADETD